MANVLLRYPFRSATVLMILVISGALYGYGLDVDGAQAVARYTARLSFLIFALVFSISAWHLFFRSELSAALLVNRRRLGLTFAYAHFVHLIALSVFIVLSGARPQPIRLAGGALAYLLLTAMAATSNDAAVKKLGHKRWKQLHTAGIYYLWFVFFMTYLPRLQGQLPEAGGSVVEYIPLFFLLITILIFRLAATFAPRASRT
jgi:DMSO/TMAO reductase YedYZ heme-binding membrane subunit